MKSTKLSWFLASILLFLVFILFNDPKLVKSATAGHLVISEIMARTVASADDEFVELYNPTGSPVDLTGWRLTKKPQDASPESSLIASISGTIASHGFFLITSDVSTSSPSADLTYHSSGSKSIAADNTISLYSDAGVTLVDKVGFGTASDSEASPAAQPTSGHSIERKANSSSTADSMTTGADQNAGNGEDTDNNLNDFIVRSIAQPQSSTAAAEPIASASPSATASATASASPEESASPSASATASASPITSPSVSPSASASSTPSAIPSGRLRFSCQVTFVKYTNFFLSFNIPRIKCGFKTI